MLCIVCSWQVINKCFKIFWRQGTLEMKCKITDADSIVCNTVQGRAADRCVVRACFQCSVLHLGGVFCFDKHALS